MATNLLPAAETHSLVMIKCSMSFSIKFMAKVMTGI